LDRLFATFVRLGWKPLFTRAFVEKCIADFLKTVRDTGVYLLRVMMSDVVLSLKVSAREEPKDVQYGYLWDYTRPMPELKTLDYKDVLEALKTIDRTQQELLIISEDSRVLEGATSCLIFCENNRLIIPHRDRLESITLNFVVEMLKKSFPCEERDVYLDELETFDEILLCGSGKGIVCLGDIEDAGWRCRSVSFFRHARILYDNAMIDYKYKWM